VGGLRWPSTHHAGMILAAIANFTGSKSGRLTQMDGGTSANLAFCDHFVVNGHAVPIEERAHLGDELACSFGGRNGQGERRPVGKPADSPIQQRIHVNADDLTARPIDDDPYCLDAGMLEEHRHGRHWSESVPARHEFVGIASVPNVDRGCCGKRTILDDLPPGADVVNSLRHGHRGSPFSGLARRIDVATRPTQPSGDG
jgi:hypothetical protein